MSRENVDQVRAVYAEWANGNFALPSGVFRPDCKFEFDTPDSNREEICSDDIAGYMREFLSSWKAFRITAAEIIDLGDTVLVTEHQRATGKASGVETEQNNYAIWTFREGLVAYVRWRLSRTDALEAAGISE